MTTSAPPAWLDDAFSVLPTNFVSVTNAAALTPAAGAAATITSPPITVQKSGNFLIFVCVRGHYVAAAADHNTQLTVTGTDSFTGTFAPTVPGVNDVTGSTVFVTSAINLDRSGLARGSTVSYTASFRPTTGTDTLAVNANEFLIIVVEL